MRTIHYSNGNEITTDRILNYNLRREQDNVIIKDTKYSFKNSEDIYVMASPNRRGIITIGNMPIILLLKQTIQKERQLEDLILPQIYIIIIM